MRLVQALSVFFPSILCCCRRHVSHDLFRLGPSTHTSTTTNHPQLPTANRQPQTQRLLGPWPRRACLVVQFPPSLDSPQFNQQPRRSHIGYKFRSGRQQVGQGSYAHVGISSRKSERKSSCRCGTANLLDFHGLGDMT
ncbi:hypothetical protein DFP73DRAFT_137386 [Morchella snyderi]|nr:hypothetical protein DFP73DRAFT_137386 [Morchella snyderi]